MACLLCLRVAFLPAPAAYTGRRCAFALAALFDALPKNDNYFTAIQV